MNSRACPHTHTHIAEYMLRPACCYTPVEEPSTLCPKPTGYEPGCTTNLRYSTTLFLVKHDVVFRKIYRRPPRSAIQQERYRLQQSCAELQTGQRSQNEKSNRLPRSILKTFSCWAIVEGIESEPTKDDIKMTIHC